MPQFSDELLKAVNNWTRIPQSVFPLSAVTIKQAVQFSVKASNGQVMANSSLPPGSEVVVVELMEINFFWHRVKTPK